MGAYAGELVLAIQARLRGIVATVHIYLTLAEVIRRAGDEARKASFIPRLQRIPGAYLCWQRR